MMNPGISRSSSFSQEIYDTALSGYSADTESSRPRGSQASPPSRLPSLERNPNASEALPQENELPSTAPDSLLAEAPPTIGNSALQEIETSLGHVATNLTRIQENAPPEFQAAEMRGLAHELIKPHKLSLQFFEENGAHLPPEAAESFSAPLLANLISLNNLNSVASSEIPGQVTQAFNAACDAVKFLKEHLPAEEPRHSEGMPQAGAVAAPVEEPENVAGEPRLSEESSVSTLSTRSHEQHTIPIGPQTVGVHGLTPVGEISSLEGSLSSGTYDFYPPVGTSMPSHHAQGYSLVEEHEIPHEEGSLNSHLSTSTESDLIDPSLRPAYNATIPPAYGHEVLGSQVLENEVADGNLAAFYESVRDISAMLEVSAERLRNAEDAIDVSNLTLARGIYLDLSEIARQGLTLTEERQQENNAHFEDASMARHLEEMHQRWTDLSPYRSGICRSPRARIRRRTS